MRTYRFQATRAGGFAGNRRHLLLLGLAGLILGQAAYLAAQSAKPPATRPAALSAATAPTTEQAAAQKKEQEIARVMEFFRVTQPDVYAQAKTLRDADPAQFEKLVRGALGTVNHLEDLRKRDPVQFDLKMKDLELAYKSLRLARELQRNDLDPSERQRVSADLRAVVTQEFDVCQQMRQEAINFIKNRVQDLDKDLQNRAKQKDALIKQRIQDLTEKSPKLEW
ncbi:MAG TPA: hypothetical protein VHQ47_13465 [Phycisphaerae bacterium]|jgi:hypothetical protein|nr:hypothetical protein [Phycisphaerae bacterium]